ncbi:hypothetical protein [Aestuariirhabdus litorea]|uniref:Uncharacterized protein n=1 Tax=Aestuariirhabdus litorea TaxID=2528527 RepID=A0A3P3VLI3_9GAMM|nr:hypothetical protein [Aestuariirhabdus litorea]RRJ83612.1 hypothetical protein D0544_00355 [Aestuariirhabdus litorea]RWW96833.1 hypothetical protein DZC74_00355 [Endozoicomonadaceae bacterium GTF-13]
MKRLLLLPLALLLLLSLVPTLGWFYSVERLSYERPLAEIEFRSLGPQHYLATLSGHKGCQREEFELFGDQWRIDAQVIKWKTVATLLGLDARYRLERLSGRYQNLGEANQRPQLAYDIGHTPTLDLVALSAWLGRFNGLLDAEYGSSTYQTMDPQRRYRVYLTQSGLITRSEPREPARYADGSLTIRINRACEQQSSLWQRLVTGSDRWLGRLLNDF